MAENTQKIARRARKQNGVHYTPPELAAFLATETVKALTRTDAPICVLDPACGDGVLLWAIAAALEPRRRARTTLVGYETDERAISLAERSLSGCGVANVSLRLQDFLDRDFDEPYDAVIANPPYVRTQVLGADRAQVLAERFGLTGRVDLSYAFIRSISNALRPGGVVGLLTSNRFLTVRAGAMTRSLLRTEFETRALYDLGDTKLFSAAVLPAITIAVRRPEGRGLASHPPKAMRKDQTLVPTTFTRVYSCTSGDAVAAQESNLLETLSDCSLSGIIRASEGHFRIERGVLADTAKPDDVWRLKQPKSERWLSRVRAAQAMMFGDVATIRVGIKTTADAVFVRSDWHELPEAIRPEEELLRPLITHREATRWSITPTRNQRRVLYPHLSRGGRRVPIELEDFPRTAAYLRSHEARLRGRRYVTDAGRRWYEIWVAHDPAAWAQPKIAFPDIAESPRFSLDRSGAVVQGDCYWITLKPGVDARWLPLMLAVANSSLATKFYDILFHNKLYAGRRRYMTQYVEQFPLPRLEAFASRTIVARSEELCATNPGRNVLEREIEAVVEKAFGLDD
ncbi:MAG: N-6 DNA methylase [Planctomycetota bacterium]|nr:N-6 DNA methylase [Planctomycetaceae bacterium]MDQ3331335.1 N-6 DNA methylase [Planctomycetota bacterium]